MWNKQSSQYFYVEQLQTRLMPIAYDYYWKL